ncbi:MAG: TonB-dependent receptor [bacterium]|nr:TonB-dependent receptor [bacterium]
MIPFIKIQKIILLVMIFSLISCWAYAGQTGKIAGKVIDKSNGEALVGVNIIIRGTTIGAASDLQGDFIILNVPPGSYSLLASMIGYQTTIIENVKVFSGRTTHVNFNLEPMVIDLGESVTITAEQPLVQKDLTSSSSSISSDEIKLMPVESFHDILQLQAGVVKDAQGEFHVRGGRSSEIAYMVDGMSVSDPFSGKAAINVDQSNIQEMKVISGTFNAEYGKAMSGIVEIITKEPEDKLHMGGSFYTGDYISNRDDLFLNIDDIQPAAIYNTQVYLTGALPGFNKNLSFYLSFRKFYNQGWLYGQRKYNPSDSSNLQNPDAIYFEKTGDDKIVPMNDKSQYFVNAKLVYRFTPSMKLSYSFLGDLSEYSNYNHLFKYNPDGDVTNSEYGFTNIFNFNHMLSSNTFYTLKFSHYYYDFKSFLYEDNEDPRYVNPVLLRNREDAFSFLTGGTNMSHFYRNTTVDAIKFDITSQVTKIHQLKAGIEYKHNKIHLRSFPASYQGEAGGGIFSSEAFFNLGEYQHHPVEFSAYLQDKVELQNMILNIGLRYDYFNSRGKIPKDRRDPSNTIKPETNAYQDTEAKHQLSPRIGIAFPISASGVFHVSYGHFFQIPPYEYLYLNPRLVVAPGGLNTLMGNADLNPQSTVIYEVGFQQELLGQLGIDVTGFFKDARNLLGTKIFETYILGDRYALYDNRDYGNIRGITLAVNKRPTAADFLTISFDYTYQIAEGNASDPNHEFYNKQSDPPNKSNIQVIPLDWDQRHTVNLSVSYNNPKYIGIGIIAQFQSGLPYTPEIQSQETTFQNSGLKPFNYNLDLRLFKRVKIWNMNYVFFVKVYNLMDRKNEINVYSDTGRAGYSLISKYVGERRAYVNTLDEWLKRPDFYSEPRKVFIGFEVEI